MNWTQFLKITQFAYNNTVNQTIQKTLFRTLIDINPNFQLRENSKKTEILLVELQLL